MISVGFKCVSKKRPCPARIASGYGGFQEMIKRLKESSVCHLILLR